MERESEINSTSWMRLTTVFHMHQAGDLKYILFLVCGAHRNGLTTWRHEKTSQGPGGGVVVIGASCPYSTMKGPPVSSHTNLIHTLHLTSRPTPQGFLVGREDFGLTQLGRTGHFRGSCGALEVRSDFTLESPRNYLANKENKGWPTIPMNGHAWQSCDREKTSVASRTQCCSMR